MLFGNAITVPAGYFLASKGNIDWLVLVAVFTGSSLIIASACVLNNVLDQDIDRLMERTKKRPLISGEVSTRSAIIFCILLGITGFAILLSLTHILVSLVGLIGFIDYVWLYGAWSKRKSIHGTLVGSISGATPILAGYVAASHQIDIGAVLVFAILFTWQMPEFYSIAVYRLKEYKAAQVPILSVVKGIEATKKQILLYTITFVALTLMLSFFNYTGLVYTVVMAICGGYWIWLGIKGLQTNQHEEWARKMFRFSLVILMTFCILISIDAFIP